MKAIIMNNESEWQGKMRYSAPFCRVFTVKMESSIAQTSPGKIPDEDYNDYEDD